MTMEETNNEQELNEPLPKTAVKSKKGIIIAIIIILALVAVYLIVKPKIGEGGSIIPSGDLQKACTDAGGMVGQFNCCNSANDFPDGCHIGACGCASGESHTVKVCECPGGSCWNGKACMPDSEVQR